MEDHAQTRAEMQAARRQLDEAALLMREQAAESSRFAQRMERSIDRLDALVRGNDQTPGLGARVNTLEESDRRQRSYALVKIGALWTAIIGLAFRVFTTH